MIELPSSPVSLAVAYLADISCKKFICILRRIRVLANLFTRSHLSL